MIYAVTGGSFLIGEVGETKEAADLKDTNYAAVNQATKKGRDPAVTRGAELKIAFRADNAQAPNAGGQVMRVSLVQMVQDNTVVTDVNGFVTHNGYHSYTEPQIQVANGTPDDGARIDQQFFSSTGALVNVDPRYAQQRLAGTEKLIAQNPKKGDVKVTPTIDGVRSMGTASGGWAGERTGTTFSLAMLRDQPGTTIRTGPNADTVTGNMRFEIAVLFEATSVTPATWGGSISWGYDINPAGLAVTVPIAVVVGGGRSVRFGSAIARWNAAAVGGSALLPLP